MPLLLCDLNDSLIDRAPVFQSWAEMFSIQHGQDGTFVAWLVKFNGAGRRPRDDFFIEIRERLALDTSAFDLKARYHQDLVELVRPDVEIISALKRVRAADWLVAIVSNGSIAELQRKRIASAGIDKLVDTVCISPRDGAPKPDPCLFRLAGERCGSSLDGAWMVGDHPSNDIGGAVAAGLSSVWLRRGRSWPYHDYFPTAEADSFSQAVEQVLGSTR
jgi:putative hydrolase of the HAD superfamily